MRASQPWRTNRARTLRSNATSAEDAIWDALRDRQLDGLKFARQVPIGNAYVDFVCRAHRVIVEIDGATHGMPSEIAQDVRRSRSLEGDGYRVFRVTNTDVFENLDSVLDHLLAFIQGDADAN
jgi:very-short-patch-repair endonuclease